jgi:glycosyltransferase involved in cell wall biosynthesis
MLEDKGIREAVLAARELRRRGSKIQIWLVGAPDDENPTSISNQILARWHEEGCVRWLGHQVDVKSVWSKAHISILPSYREGMPLALLEAAACGRPIVATDVPGCNDFVVDGVNGFLVPKNDWMKLADGIETLANSGDLRARFGAAARKRVEAGYGQQTVVDQTIALYRKGINEIREKPQVTCPL